jgi:hypothetical protein
VTLNSCPFVTVIGVESWPNETNAALKRAQRFKNSVFIPGACCDFH